MNKTLFSHTYLMDVRWGDADVLGHINNVEYLRYAESGRVAYCSDVMNMVMGTEIDSGWILADMRCTYLQQVHYPCTLEVCTSVTKVGNKSAVITANIYRKGEQEAVITTEGVMVWFDYKLQKTTTIPDNIRTNIADFEQSVEGLAS